MAAGGHLVSLNSQAEQELVAATFGHSSYWIGLSDEVNEGEFVWSDGSPLDFEFWNGGSSNSTNSGSRDYAYFSTTDGAWGLDTLSRTIRSVVETAAPAGSPDLLTAGRDASYRLNVTISDLVPPVVTELTRLPDAGGSTATLLSTFSATISEEFQAATIAHPRIATFNGHRYLLVRESLTWEEAEALASSYGGY